MKRYIAPILFLMMTLSAIADNEMVYLSFTNTDPNTPRMTFSGSMLRRSAYTIDTYFRSSSSNAANVAGYTVQLNWKATGRLQDSPVTRVVGTVMSGTGGWVRAIIPKDSLNSVGDTTFLMSAFDTSNRVAIFWNCTVYDSVDQVSDDEFIPPGDETNFYTQAQIDALLTNFLEHSEADGYYVNTGEVVAASLISVNTNNFTAITGGTNAQTALDSIDDQLTNRATFSQADARYINTGEVVAASSISVATNNFSYIPGGTTAQLALDAIDDEFSNRVSRAGDSMNNFLIVSGNVTIATGDLFMASASNKSRSIWFLTDTAGSQSNELRVASDGTLIFKRGTNAYGFVWNSVNDGAGSALDADTLDGNDSASFVFTTNAVLRYSTNAITAMTNAAINYTFTSPNATSLYICITNNWRGSGTNWGRIIVGDF